MLEDANRALLAGTVGGALLVTASAVAAHAAEVGKVAEFAVPLLVGVGVAAVLVAYA